MGGKLSEARLVVAPIDIAALRAERDRRSGHHMLGHLRTEAYRSGRAPIYPRAGVKPPTIAGNERAIAQGKSRWRQKESKDKASVVA